jgi:hypothetical protein
MTDVTDVGGETSTAGLWEIPPKDLSCHEIDMNVQTMADMHNFQILQHEFLCVIHWICRTFRMTRIVLECKFMGTAFT